MCRWRSVLADLLLLVVAPVAMEAASADQGTCLCNSARLVGDCCCDFESTTRLNEDHILPLLKQLAEGTKFFQYYKVALCGQCHHRLPQPSCGNPECSVCECSADDLPCDTSGKCYLDVLASHEQKPDACTDEASSTAADGHVDRILENAPSWSEAKSEWMIDSVDALEYVDLHRNPERWTGYTHKTGADFVWQAIHNETECFAKATSRVGCREHRVLSRLISGLHSSISMHIAKEFCTKPGAKWMPCEEFGESLAEFRSRLYDHPERIENLYFVYLFTLRAMLKAGPQLKAFDYDAGDTVEIAQVKAGMADLLRQRDAPCLGVTRSPFDETTVFADENATSLKDAFQNSFKNIASIMDCVGCSKCRLWGKLQVHGLGVALRILFANQQQPALTRTDVIALVHTAFRFSSSIAQVAQMSQRIASMEAGSKNIIHA